MTEVLNLFYSKEIATLTSEKFQDLNLFYSKKIVTMTSVFWKFQDLNLFYSKEIVTMTSENCCPIFQMF